MRDRANEHHERVESAYMAGAEKSPKLVCSRLNQVRPEPFDAIPGYGDRSAGTKSKRIVSAREKENRHVNQRLKRV